MLKSGPLVWNLHPIPLGQKKSFQNLLKGFLVIRLQMVKMKYIHPFYFYNLL